MGSEARARLGLAAVLLVALLSFNQLFEPGDYPGPALLGMLLATGLAVGARRLGIGSLPTLTLSAAGLAWYVSFVFQTDHTLFGLPTPGAFARVVDSVSRGLQFAQIDFAPVPVRPGYVVLVVAGMWAAAALGELATFRWKRPLLAVLPAVVMFSITMVVGSGQGGPVLVVFFLAALLTFWGLESSHRLRSWGRWVATWPDHAPEEPDSVTGSLARRMGAGCLAVALFSPLFLPALGDGLVAWRSELGEGLGSGDGSGGSGRIDPLVSIAPSLVRQSDQVLFRVSASRGAYWRLATLLHFDGETWRPDGEEGEIEVEGVSMPQRWLPWPENSTRVEQTVTLAGLGGRYLPAAVQADEIEMLDEDRAGDLRYHPATGDLRIRDQIGGELAYRVSSVAPTPRFEDLVDARIGELALAPVYREVPELSAEVMALRDQWIEGETSPYGRLVAIQDALRSGAFTYSLPQPQDLTGHQNASTDHLARFLLETKTGYCQQFATAFAALSRSLGYPTRVVVGFLPGDQTDENEYVVRGTDAHAWPEVHFEEWGWIRFEPTPRVDSTRTVAAPGYTLPAGASGEGPLGTDGGAGRGGPGGNAPQSNLDARALNDAEGTGSAIQFQELGRGGEGVAGPDAESEANAVWERTFRRLMLVLLAAAAFGLVSIPALKARRIRRAYRRAVTPGDIAAAAFREFMLEAGELAAPKGPAESARAYAGRIAAMKQLPVTQALRLATIYELALYAPTGPDAADGREARSLARDLRATLWHRATMWERGIRLFSLRPDAGRSG